MTKKMRTASRSAVNQRAYRSRQRDRLEPADRYLDAAITRALAHASEEVLRNDVAASRKLLNSIYGEAGSILAEEGYDAEISTEALQRRIRFMLKEKANPQASAKERKAWSYPLPSALKRIRNEG